MGFKSLLSRLVLMTAGLASTCGILNAEDSPHWSYSGQTGPQYWSELSPEYITCGSGIHQSPVDISGAIKSDLEPLVFKYQLSSIDLLIGSEAL